MEQAKVLTPNHKVLVAINGQTKYVPVSEIDALRKDHEVSVIGLKGQYHIVGIK